MQRFLTVVVVAVTLTRTLLGGDEPTPLDVFDQRILPIFRSSQPSSCVQCHLSSVDLKKYILPSHEKTFASLRDQGLIDLDQPLKSKILTLIQMGEKDLDKGARLIHETVRKAEYEAFAAWIRACCEDPHLRDLPVVDESELVGPVTPDEVIRHGRKSRILDSFVRNVWSHRMRCFPCHTPHEIDASNPKHKAAVRTRGEMEAKYGESLGDRLDLFRETPAETMRSMLESSRYASDGTLPLINQANPSQSLLILKPTSKIPKRREDGSFEPPSSTAPVSHMGGLKMHKDDHSYKMILTWIQDYANVVEQRYASKGDLPRDNWYSTKQILRLRSAPKAWPVGTPVQMFVYAREAGGETWNSDPVAFTQGTVTPRRVVNGALILFLPPDASADTSAHSIEPGDYLIKVYVDRDGRLKDDPALLLDEDDFVGQIERNGAEWKTGFRNAEVVMGKQLEP